MSLETGFSRKNPVSRGDTLSTAGGCFYFRGLTGIGPPAGRIVLRNVHTGFTTHFSGLGPDMISWYWLGGAPCPAPAWPDRRARRVFERGVCRPGL
ncbi:protein of unknown function [Candidatus Promineifilum breve]|uniref:Uncharacterized protein n=1 Tax=Candidatus Promineifilum breve TaxID=1806508 RepID=A0A160T4Y1_9CHLR|nr:protein of unknown function [Candidatus Promineifilum breve]